MSEAIDHTRVEYETLLSFVYMCPVGVVRLNRDGLIDMANPCAARLLLPATGTKEIANLFITLEDCAPELRHMVASFNPATGTICDQYRIFPRGRGAGARAISCSLTKLSADCIMAVLQDITGQVEQERLLAQSDVLLDALVAGINDFALFSIDRFGQVESWNTDCIQQTGFSAGEVIGQSLLKFYHPPRGGPKYLGEHIACARREGRWLQDGVCERRDGSRFACQLLITFLGERADGPGGFAVIVRDITERRQTTAALRRLLTTDQLTGALNRARFFDVGNADIGRCEQAGRPLSLLMLDVDHFKQINDRFGHAAGDEVLRRLVTNCRRQLREDDHLARLGGEEFAVLLPGTPPAAAERIAERLRAAVAADASAASGPPANVTISIGCATVEPPMPSLDDILKLADEALYRAKHTGRDRVCSARPARHKHPPSDEAMGSGI